MHTRHSLMSSHCIQGILSCLPILLWLQTDQTQCWHQANPLPKCPGIILRSWKTVNENWIPNVYPPEVQQQVYPWHWKTIRLPFGARYIFRGELLDFEGLIQFHDFLISMLLGVQLMRNEVSNRASLHFSHDAIPENHVSYAPLVNRETPNRPDFKW